jgi:hypothetical protein
MLYKVFARTKRTDWVEINAFETKDEAVSLMREIVNGDVGTEAMMETHEQASDGISCSR